MFFSRSMLFFVAAGALSFTAQLGHAKTKARQTKDEIKCKNAETQVEMNECAAKEKEKTEKLMLSTFEAALSKLTPIQKERLQKAQEAWVQVREQTCMIEGDIGGGCDDEGKICGSIRPLYYLGCLARENRWRAEAIKDLSR